MPSLVPQGALLLPRVNALVIIGLASAFGVAGCSYDWDSTWTVLADASVDTMRDAALHDEAPPGERGPKPDGPTSSWSVHIRTWPGAYASCESDEFAVGGGATCAAGKVISLSAPKGNPQDDDTVRSWWGSCSTSENPDTTYLVCVKSASGQEPRVKVVGETGTGKKRVDAHCDSGDQLVGGGCLCTSPNLISSRPHSVNQTWMCECDGGPLPSHKAFALCAPALAKGLQLQQGTTSGPIATCPKGKLALGGGCQGKGKSSRPGTAGWTCDSGTAHVICAAVTQH